MLQDFIAVMELLFYYTVFVTCSIVHSCVCLNGAILFTSVLYRPIIE